MRSDVAMVFFSPPYKNGLEEGHTHARTHARTHTHTHTHTHSYASIIEHLIKSISTLVFVIVYPSIITSTKVVYHYPVVLCLSKRNVMI